MTFVAFGMPLLVLFMAVVMFVPLSYFMRRDARFNAAKDETERLKIWYNCA